MFSKYKLKLLLTKVPPVKLAYLIGSFATGQARRDSDLDIVLVTDKEGLRKLDYSKLYRQINHMIHSFSLDLRLIVPEETNPIFLFQIYKHGDLLYAASEKDRVEFEIRSMKYYFDSQHLRNIFNSHLDRSFENRTYGY